MEIFHFGVDGVLVISLVCLFVGCSGVDATKCYNSLSGGKYLKQVTDSALTITSLYLMPTVIAQYSDSYLAVSIARPV